MADKPEVKVKKKIMALLEKHKAYKFYPVQGGYGKSGIPDIVACLPLRTGADAVFLGIEAKAGNKKPTVNQRKNLKAVLNAQGFAAVVNQNNMREFAAWLELIVADDDTPIPRVLLPEGYTLEYDVKVGV